MITTTQNVNNVNININMNMNEKIAEEKHKR